MADTQTFDPAAAGFRVASTPIKRKARRPSSRSVPRPQYADAVWYSFEHSHPLEAVVPVRAVEDTIRKLKAAARFLERTEHAEVRVQIGVEPELDGEGQPTKKSVVKFLGHEPWLLGRRVAKAAASQAEDTPVAPARHRRTTAATRSPAHARKASLPDPLVRSVITRRNPSARVPGEGLPSLREFSRPPYHRQHGHCLGVIQTVPSSYPCRVARGLRREPRGREVGFGLLQGVRRGNRRRPAVYRRGAVVS